MLKRFLFRGVVIFLILLVLPAAAQEPECDDPPPPNYLIDPGLLPFCTKDTTLPYDLLINSWDLDLSIFLSPNIRISDPLDSPSPEQPIFLFDTAGNRFYTKLYSSFLNNSAGLACPDCPVTGPPKVTFSYVGGNPSIVDVNDPATSWVTIGEYIMNITTADGVLYPNETHYQQKAVCWHMPPPRIKFPQEFILKAELSWEYDDDLFNNVAYSYYDLSPLKREAQIAFAMDLSGSMSSLFDGVNTRLDVAKQKAILFADLVEAGNYLGVYSFSTNNNVGPYQNTPFTADYNDPPQTETLNETAVVALMGLVSGNPDDLSNNYILPILAQTYHGCTPIGQGLLRAKEGLEAISSSSGLTPAKAIVLFSDGFQNVPPFVNSPPSYTCFGYPPYNDINAVETFASKDISIYSVHFGPEVGWAYDLMNQIKDQTGGEYVYGAATEIELAAVYYAIRGMIDDMVYLEEDGTTSAGGPYPQFEVNFDEAAKVATVAVAWPLADKKARLTIDRRKKGDTEWIANQDPVKTTTGNIYLAHDVYRFTPGPDTTWEFRVRQVLPRVGQTTYAAAVFSDVARARIKASLDAVGFETGKPLPMYVSLHSGGYPVMGANVTAKVKVPARSFSSTLRKYYKRFSQGMTPDSNRVSTILPELKKFLKEDVGSDDIYIYRDVVLRLKDDGVLPDKMKDDGIYSAVLSAADTQTAGDYEITFDASGTLSSGRSFERSTKLSTICNVGPVDTEKSAVEMSVSPPRSDGTRQVTILILPTDRFGNAAFPGSTNKIKVSSKGGTLQGGIVDNLDSSFTQLLELRAGETAEIDVVVGGISLGTFSTEKPLLRHELSLHSGFVSPEGLFDELVSGGKCLAFDYAYRLNHNFALRSEFALNWFNDRLNGNLLLTNANLYLQYRYLSGRLVPYFETGLGIYKLENNSSALGYGAGVGAQLILSKRWNLDLNIHGHRVGGKLDLSFIQVLAGLNFKF
jgi:opacity protein-like surface antigen